MRSRRNLKKEISDLNLRIQIKSWESTLAMQENSILKDKISRLESKFDNLKSLAISECDHEYMSKMEEIRCLEDKIKNLESKKWRKEYLKVIDKLEKITNKKPF